MCMIDPDSVCFNGIPFSVHSKWCDLHSTIKQNQPLLFRLQFVITCNYNTVHSVNIPNVHIMDNICEMNICPPRKK